MSRRVLSRPQAPPPLMWVEPAAAAWQRWRACARSLWVPQGARASVSSSGIGEYRPQLRWLRRDRVRRICRLSQLGVFAAAWMPLVLWRWAQAWLEWAYL